MDGKHPLRLFVPSHGLFPVEEGVPLPSPEVCFLLLGPQFRFRLRGQRTFEF